MNILLTCLVTVFNLGQFGRISFVNQQINIYAYEIVCFILLLFFVYKEGFSPFGKLFKNLKVASFFYGWLFISFLLSLFHYPMLSNLVAFLYLLRICFYGIFGLYFYTCFIKHDFQQLLAQKFTYDSILILLTSYIQYLFFPYLRPLIAYGWDPHLYRAFGVFFDPAISAGVYGYFYFYYLSQKKNTTTFIFIALFFGLVLLSFSRIAYIAVILVTSYYFFQTQKKRIIPVFIAATILVILFVIPKPWGEGVNLGRSFSIESRYTDMKLALNIAYENPIFGIGYNHIRQEKELSKMVGKNDVTHAGASFHSSYLIILVTSGIGGFLIFLRLLYEGMKNLKILLLSFLYICILSLVDNILLHPFILFLLFISMPLNIATKARA